MTRFVPGLFSVGMIVLAAGTVSGQDYPTKAIRIVTTAAGGPGDFASRLIAQGISGPLGQPVVVDNRPTGVIPPGIVSQAPPDGYTLLISGASFWMAALLRNTSYDPVRDFAPISLVTRAPLVLVVHPSVPAKSVKELIALAKARPGELNYSSSSSGSSSHLAAELFKYMTGVNIVRIPYKSGSVEMTDLIGGYAAQLTFNSAIDVVPHIKSGKLRALAVTTPEPSALAPGLPTVAASGLPGYDAAQLSGVFAPAKTPETVINRLNQEIVRVLNRAEVKEKYLNAGAEAIGSSPEQLAATMKSQMSRLGKMIKDVGIRAD